MMPLRPDRTGDVVADAARSWRRFSRSAIPAMIIGIVFATIEMHPAAAFWVA
jgi:hypothetical protein